MSGVSKPQLVNYCRYCGGPIRIRVAMDNGVRRFKRVYNCKPTCRLK